MRTIRNILMVCSLSLLLPIAASAQSLSEVQAMSKEDRRSYIESMSDDERSAMREKWRAEFEQLPEEQKAAIREQRQKQGAGGNRSRGRNGDREAMRQRWESMSEEERAVAKEKFRANEQERRAKRESMSEEERAAMREKRGEHKGQPQGAQHKGNSSAESEN
jgi:hypothetical protein